MPQDKLREAFQCSIKRFFTLLRMTRSVFSPIWFDKWNYEPYHNCAMRTKVLAKKIKQDGDYIYLKSRKDTLEAFCDTAGLYRQEFLDLLDESEKDHRAGRVTKRKSLYELITEI